MKMEREQKIIIIGIVMIAAVLSIGTILVLSASASAYLKILTPVRGDLQKIGSTTIVTGTSVTSNTTRTHCTVTLQTNHGGYKPVTPLAKDGSYTNWRGVASEVVKQGVNQVEAKFQCFAPNSNMTIPNFTKHLTHNFTGIA
jgi:hypothetical protein